MMRRRHELAEAAVIKRSAVAFTLIELLVVIAILATLASMLMSAAAKAIERARAATCLGNIKQAYALIVVFTDDDDGRYPYSNSQCADKRQDCVYFREGVATPPGAPAFVCPSSKYKGRDPWGQPVKAIGVNEFLMPYDYNCVKKRRYRQSEVARPSEVIMVGDCAQQGPPYRAIPYLVAWYMDNEGGLAANANQPLDDTIVPQGGFWGPESLLTMRHNGRANFAHVDGSAGSVSHISQLKQRNMYFGY